MSVNEGQFCENALLALRWRSDKQSKIRSTASDFTTKFGVLLQIFTPDRAVWQTHNIVPQGLIYLGIAPVPRTRTRHFVPRASYRVIHNLHTSGAPSFAPRSTWRFFAHSCKSWRQQEPHEKIAVPVSRIACLCGLINKKDLH